MVKRKRFLTFGICVMMVFIMASCLDNKENPQNGQIIHHDNLKQQPFLVNSWYIQGPISSEMSETDFKVFPHDTTEFLDWRNKLKVNRGTINKYANYLNSRIAAGKFHYSVEISSCVTHTSNALNLSGVFNIGIHPYLLNAQMYLWSHGIRPWTICNYKQ